MGAQLQQCGFFGLGPTVSEADLRAAIRFVAKAERQNWFDSEGHAVAETADQQFGHLVRYWLAGMDNISPAILTFAQAKSVDFSFNYGELLDPDASDADVDKWVAFVQAELLEGGPVGGNAPDVNARVKVALRGARNSRLGTIEGPWSAVFIVSCIRRAAIIRGLEGESGGLYVGRNELLLATTGHRFYVQEAYERRFDSGPKDGTYHAFCPASSACSDHAFCPDGPTVQVGDIIVQDRNLTIGDIAEVDDFCDIPTAAFLGPNPLHGDIVVEVSSSDVETIGGNLISGDPSTPAVFSVRRRRYPLNPDGTLAVAREKLFTQEDDTGNLPAIPADDLAPGVNSKSTGRIFALLKPVPFCVTLSTSG